MQTARQKFDLHRYNPAWRELYDFLCGKIFENLKHCTWAEVFFEKNLFSNSKESRLKLSNHDTFCWV